jgi:hypothetical protein
MTAVGDEVVVALADRGLLRVAADLTVAVVGGVVMQLEFSSCGRSSSFAAVVSVDEASYVEVPAR